LGTLCDPFVEPKFRFGDPSYRYEFQDSSRSDRFGRLNSGSGLENSISGLAAGEALPDRHRQNWIFQA
jgi:hypothetical protein